jgi:hypothetical protein
LHLEEKRSSSQINDYQPRGGLNNHAQKLIASLSSPSEKEGGGVGNNGNIDIRPVGSNRDEELSNKY